MRKSLCVFMCKYIYMRVYAHIYACICMGEYVCVCMWTHINVCEGPYHPLRFGRRGCCFDDDCFYYHSWRNNVVIAFGTLSSFLIRVRTPNLTCTLHHPTCWLISNFPIALTGDIIFLSQSLLLLLNLHKWYSHAPQPCAPTVDHQPTTRTRI